MAFPENDPELLCAGSVAQRHRDARYNLRIVCNQAEPFKNSSAAVVQLLDHAECGKRLQKACNLGSRCVFPAAFSKFPVPLFLFQRHAVRAPFDFDGGDLIRAEAGDFRTDVRGGICRVPALQQCKSGKHGQQQIKEKPEDRFLFHFLRLHLEKRRNDQTSPASTTRPGTARRLMTRRTVSILFMSARSCLRTSLSSRRTCEWRKE